MFWRSRGVIPLTSPRLLELGGGEALTLDDLRSHCLVMGSTNAGKSFSTEPLLKNLHQLGSPMLITAIKPDEHRRILRVTQGRRYVRVSPGSPYRINLLDYLQKSYGSAEAVADFIRRLNESALRSTGNANQELYWSNLFDQATLNGIRLVWIAFGELSLESVYMALSTAPRTPEAAKLPEAFETSIFGQMLKQAIANRTDAIEHDLQRVIDFFKDYSSLGEKAQGAILSMVNGTLGRLLSGPFYEAFNQETTLTPEIIEAERLTVLLDYPVLTHGPAAKLFQLAWCMLFQGYCLRRDASSRDVPSILVRDECQFSLSPEWDMQVQTVARSQKLCMISLVQDLDVLRAALGGDPRAEVETFGFVSNHGVKLLFGNSNSRTGDYFSSMIGEHRELFISVSSSAMPSENLVDELLGVGRFQHSVSQQMRPYITASNLASLPQGYCVVHQVGRTFRGKPYMIASLRRA
jgi:hypothetical protein